MVIVTIVILLSDKETDHLCHQEHRAYCEGRPLLPCFAGCSLAPRGSTGELSCQTCATNTLVTFNFGRSFHLSTVLR